MGGRNREEKVRLKPIGIGILLAKEEVAPSPGVWWRRRRRRRRRAPPRSCSTLWGGKAARNLLDPPLHPPPASPFPPPRSSRRLPPSSPKPAASTDLSNGCTFLGAGRGVTERLNRGRKARGSERATPARRAPGSSAARSSGRGGEKGERGGECRTAPRRRSGAIPATGGEPAAPAPTWLWAALAPVCGASAAQQPTRGPLAADGVFLGAKGLITVRHSWEGVCGGGGGCGESKPKPIRLLTQRSPFGPQTRGAGAARGGSDPPRRLCYKVSAGAKARV